MIDQEPSVEGHFKSAEPAVKSLYDHLLSCLNKLGEVKEDPKKTCIHLNRKSALAGVYVKRHGLNVEFKTDYPIDSPRIRKTERISRSRYHHVLPIACPADLDEQVVGWLSDAHRISS